MALLPVRVRWVRAHAAQLRTGGREDPAPSRLIVTGRYYKPALEHGGKSGRALVSQIQGNRSDRLAGGQPRQRDRQAGLLAPFGEAHGRFAPKHAGKAAPADAEFSAPRGDAVVGTRAL